MELAKRGHVRSANVGGSGGPPRGNFLSVWFAEVASGAI